MRNILLEDAKQAIEQNIKWDKLRKATVLVTGAAGMMGSYITRTLLQLEAENQWGIEVYVLVRHPEKLPGDIREKVTIINQSVDEPIKTDVSFDYIIHTAGPASPLIMKDNPVETIAANVLGTYYTLELARKSQAKGYLFISSREIYGQPYSGQKEFTEDVYGFVDPLSARSCYPEGKKAAETMCVSFAQEYGLDVKIARLAHTYGPGMSIDDGRVQADFLRDVVNNRDIVMKSEGRPIRTYTYVSDAVAAIFYILLNSDDIAYNISSPESTVSIRELAETLVDAYKDRNIKLVIDMPNTTGNTGAAPFTLGILNSQKLRELGWKPRYSLQEGLMRTVKYLEGAENR
ncbi:MAG: NAD-dependent epimerase/dehydratase family protein [Clostridiales bacterium]|nr:NAD-dependent epimerase/dehydratase family protein [Clostridiales bacterium]